MLYFTRKFYFCITIFNFVIETISQFFTLLTATNSDKYSGTDVATFEILSR